MDCGELVKEKQELTTIKCRYDVDPQVASGGLNEIYANGDTCRYYSTDLDSMMQEIMRKSDMPVRPCRHYLYVDYRERALPRIVYLNSKQVISKEKCDSTLCEKAELSVWPHNGEDYLRYKFIVASTDTVTNFVMHPNNQVFHNTKWWYPFDISQVYVHFTLRPHFVQDSVSLAFKFNGAVSFSEMVPKPDVVSMDGIIFTDAQKIKQLWKNGLWFHATFPQMNNLQTVRMFALTTLLGFFIAMSANILKNMIISLCRRRLHNGLTEK